MKPRRKILVVDDNRVNVEIIEEILGDRHELAVAGSGEQALELAPEFRPDLVLLDIMMPGIDGYETCRRMRTMPALHHTKIILVSAGAMISERIEGYEAGADDYIIKPFDEAELVAKVKVYLRLHKLEEVDRLKTELLDLLSHHARTPLNGILAPLEMIASDEDLDPGERRMLAEMAHRNALRLTSMLEQGLALSELKAGTVAFDFEQTDLRELCREVAAQAGDGSGVHSARILLDLSDPVFALVDRGRIRAALLALVDGTLLHPPTDAQVIIQARQDDRGPSISVVRRDVESPGFPGYGDDRDAISFAEENGLRLALAREIMRLHRATVRAEQDPSGGLALTARFPVVIAADPHANNGSTSPPGRRLV